MEVNKVNTQTIIANLRAEGQQSRAEYVELLALRIEELEAAQPTLAGGLCPNCGGEKYVERLDGTRINCEACGGTGQSR